MILFVITARTSVASVYTVLEHLYTLEYPKKIVVAGDLAAEPDDPARTILRNFTSRSRFHAIPNKRPIPKATRADYLNTTANLATTLAEHMQDVSTVVTIADRYETIATAMAARFLNKKLAHIQGGEDTGSIDQQIRHAITMMADYHFPATAKAEARIHAMYGGAAPHVYRFGCPKIDLVISTMVDDKLNTPKNKVNAPLVMFNPDWNELDRGLLQATNIALSLIREPTVYWIAPNYDLGNSPIFDVFHRQSRWHRLGQENPLNFYSTLIRFSYLVGNSSCCVREASAIGIPTILVGNRQQLREYGPNIVYHSANGLFPHQQLRPTLEHWCPTTTLYGSGTAGRQIAEQLVTLDSETS